jgi:signal transduction histidine kinase
MCGKPGKGRTGYFERTTNDIQNKQMEIFYIFSSLWDKTLAPYKCSSCWQDVSRYMLGALCHSFWGMSSLLILPMVSVLVVVLGWLLLLVLFVILGWSLWNRCRFGFKLYALIDICQSAHNTFLEDRNSFKFALRLDAQQFRVCLNFYALINIIVTTMRNVDAKVLNQTCNFLYLLETCCDHNDKCW